MNDDADSIRMELEFLADAAPEAHWLTLGKGGGKRAIVLPLKAIERAVPEAWHWFGRTPAGPPTGREQVCILPEPPGQQLLEVLDASAEPPLIIAWPGELSEPQTFGLEPCANLVIHDVVWTVGWRRGRGDMPTEKARTSLEAAPKPNREDLVEDLDARARWFKQRH